MNPAFFDLRRVRYIVAIAEGGSISAASRALNVAQPALSYHLSETEKALGVALFERSPTGVTPTVTGLLFIEHGKVILDAIKVAEKDVTRQISAGKEQQVIRLTMIPSFAEFVLPRIIDAVRRKIPHTTLRVIDARTLFADELIDTGKADLSIKLRGPSDGKEPPLAWETLYCIMRRDKVRGPLPFAQLAALPLVLPGKENPLRQFLEEAAEREGLRLNITMEVDGFEPRRKVVASGYGVTVFGGRSIPADQFAPDLMARKIVDPELAHPIILRAREGLDPKLERAMREILQGVLAEMAS